MIRGKLMVFTSQCSEDVNPGDILILCKPHKDGTWTVYNCWNDKLVEVNSSSMVGLKGTI